MPVVSTQISWWLFLLISIVAAVISIFVYRYTLPPVSSAKRYLLIGIRSVALALLLLAICEPLLRFTAVIEEKPHLAILVDNSLSMSLTDGRGNREKTLRSFLSSPFLQKLGGKSSIQYYSFSRRTAPLFPESLTLTGTVTDVSQALRNVREHSTTRLAAVLLISDGNYNSGNNPRYEAEKLQAPLFTLGIGDTSEQKDVSVSKLVTNEIGYVQSTIPINAVIKASGFPGRRVTVSLLHENTVVTQQELSFQTSTGMAFYPVSFTVRPDSIGLQKYSIRVSSLNGEVTTRNNSRAVVIKILKNKMQMTVIAGAPGPDVSALMQSINSDVNMHGSLFTQSPDGLFKGQTLQSLLNQQVAPLECLVLIGFPTQETSPAAMQALISLLSSQPIPLMVVIGRTVDYQKLRQLDAFLPFTILSNRIDEQTVLPAVVPQQRYHILIQRSAENDPLAIWDKLPPVYMPLSMFKTKPEALALVTGKISGVVVENPMVMIRNTLQRKSLAILAYGIWRWKLLAGANNDTRPFFNMWMPTVFRWLITREEDRFLRVQPTEQLFSRGEPIGFEAQAYNENYEPVDDADIRIDVRSLASEQRYQTILQSLGNGRYEGNIEGLVEGEYSTVATGTRNGAPYGTVTGRFSVGEQSIEFADTRCDAALLQQLSSATGGRYADVSHASELIDDLLSRQTMKPQPQTKTSEIELWNSPVLLLMIVLLLGIEWFVRKRSGML